MTNPIPGNRPSWAGADPLRPDLPLADLAGGSSGDELLARDFWDQCLAVGEPAPEFTLPNGAGESVGLNQLLDAGPVLVVFEHGQGCVACAAERRVLEENAARLHATGASLVVISADCGVAAATRSDSGHGWHEVLWDCDGQVARLFGLLCRVSGRCCEALRRAGIDVPAAADGPETVLNARAHYVLDGDAVVRYAAVDLAHDRPLELATIAAILAGLMQPPPAAG